MQQESWDGRRDGGSADRHTQVAAALPGSPHTNRAPSCSTQTAAPRRQLCPSPRTRASGSQVLHLLRFLPSEPLAHLLWEAPPTTPAPRGPCTACLNHSCPHRLSGEIKVSPIPTMSQTDPILGGKELSGKRLAGPAPRSAAQPVQGSRKGDPHVLTDAAPAATALGTHTDVGRSSGRTPHPVLLPQDGQEGGQVEAPRATGDSRLKRLRGQGQVVSRSVSSLGRLSAGQTHGTTLHLGSLPHSGAHAGSAGPACVLGHPSFDTWEPLPPARHSWVRWSVCPLRGFSSLCTLTRGPHSAPPAPSCPCLCPSAGPGSSQQPAASQGRQHCRPEGLVSASKPLPEPATTADSGSSGRSKSRDTLTLS